MIHDNFRTNDENEALLDLSVLFQYLFAKRWHSEFQALLSASEVPKERSSIAKLSKITDYGKKTFWSDDQDAQLRMQGLKTGIVKNQRGKNVSEDRRVGECELSSREQTDSVQEEAVAVFATEVLVDNVHNRPLLLQERRHRVTEENYRKRVKTNPKGTYTNRSCHYWHPPVCQKVQVWIGMQIWYVQTHWGWWSAQWSGGRRSVALLKESIQLGGVSQDSYPRKYFPREPGEFRTKHAVKFSKSTWHQKKNSGKKWSIARYYPKMCASWA